MKRRIFITLPVLIILLISSTFVVRYFIGTWAPSTYKNGLQFPEPPELKNTKGGSLSDESVQEFVQICGKLRSTSRDIFEDRGSGSVELSYPKAADNDFLTIYPNKNVVFLGWWIDAKTYSMMDRRAPCFELSTELEHFIEEHDIMRKSK